MVSIPVTPRLALILLLLLGAGVGWEPSPSLLQRWLALVAAWAGASAGILAIPLFEMLPQPLPDSTKRRMARLSSTFVPLVIVLATRLLLITGVSLSEMITKGFLCGFVPSAFYGVLGGLYHPQTRWIGEKLNPLIIFVVTILLTISALNVFAFASGIAKAGLELITFGALVYATAQLQLCIVLWTSSSARHYSAFQSLQILALIFGIGLSLGGVTSWLR